ncbi:MULTISPECIES: metal ABC transporter ATP-binding protein [Arthrobacter]|uniref:Metal ABC transporter ATP-binding protein n=3 Tax=Arthrobacter TaxID=1663 RepID=A0ABU9KNI3_9MICC|nr:metal ABC transporter ATP-binding protein [Arthrobacter sp. YJM1]MDP5228421.1 metal ABC transporter ATP-binding protein [Arthrobacter sp. YJM1]
MSLKGGGLSFGHRALWQGLDLDIRPGEFLAVLGANGSGKSSLLKVLLGLLPLSEGRLERHVPREKLGYVPQQKNFAPDTALRARDLVALGVDGHRWGIRRDRRRVHQVVDGLLEKVGALDYARVPVGQLSGGEQQRLRIAQAMASDPQVLLCDEPLLSLDPRHQNVVSALVNQRCREAGTAVVFVTHELNPVLPYVDRVLYLAQGRFRIGTPEEVMNTETLSELYQGHVEVVRSHDRLLVSGIPEQIHHEQEEVD